MKYIEGLDRSQIYLPECLEDMVAEDNPVRVIDAFVDMLDMEELGFLKSKPSDTGRPAYDPRMLLKLYLYGYFFSIRSSRKLMRECRRNIELFYLLCGLKPDFRTIADFRKVNSEAIRNAFVAFTRFCVFLELYDTAEEVAIDGSKFRAVNGNKKMFNQEILRKKFERIEHKLAEYMEELERMDVKESSEENDEPLKQMHLMDRIKTLEERKSLYEQFQKELCETGGKQLLTTDPAARMMHTTKDGYHCSYNVQTAVSAESKLIVDYQVTNHVNDQGILHNFGEQIKETVQTPLIHAIADKGYDCNDEILSCILDGTIADVGFKNDKEERLIPVKYVPAVISEEERNSKKAEDIRRSIQAGILPKCYENTNISLEVHNVGEIGVFMRGTDLSYVTCPMGKRLNRIKERKGGTVYKCKPACRECDNRCTASRNVKEVYFGPGTNYVAARMYGDKPAVNTPPPGFVPTNSFFRKNPMEKTILLRIADDPERQRRRLSISEHPFGTVKWHHGAYYVLCKGIEKTTGELGLTFLAYNIRRAINMKGAKELIEAMRGVQVGNY